MCLSTWSLSKKRTQRRAHAQGESRRRVNASTNQGEVDDDGRKEAHDLGRLFSRHEAATFGFEARGGRFRLWGARRLLLALRGARMPPPSFLKKFTFLADFSFMCGGVETLDLHDLGPWTLDLDPLVDVGSSYARWWSLMLAKSLPSPRGFAGKFCPQSPPLAFPFSVKGITGAQGYPESFWRGDRNSQSF